jgi:penicillin V acylase-like amidase (Ntn superfamily)
MKQIAIAVFTFLAIFLNPSLSVACTSFTVYNNKQMVQAMGSSLHNLVADRFGDAIVVETGETGNQITEIQDRYMVMTNFPIYQLKGNLYLS